MDRNELWDDAWRRLDVAPPASDRLAEICAQYQEPTRAYHTLQHIDECLGLFVPLAPSTPHAAEITLAIWLHDVVYDPHRDDNEAKSAEQAVQLAERQAVATESIQTIQNLILATRHNAPPQTDSAALLVDIDLAILGAERQRYDEYESQIRTEYAWVAWSRYRQGRSAILTQFLNRRSIYTTSAFQGLEKRARDNLERAIRLLAVDC